MVSHWGQFWGPILFSLYAPTGSSPPPESDHPNVHCDAEDTMVWHQGNKVTFSSPQNDQNLNLMIINYIFTHYYRWITLCSTEAEVEWVGRPGWGRVPVPCSRAVLLNWSFFCQQPGLEPETKSFLKSFQPGPMNIHMANPGLEPVTLALTVRMNHEAPGEKRWREEKITEVNRQRETFTHVSCWLWLNECVWVHQQEVGRPSDDCRIPCWLLPLYFSSVRLEEITVRTDESLNCASFHSFYSD